MAMSTGSGIRGDINITPLVDVVLVLLIIFMVTTPVLQMGLDVEVPPKVEVSEPPPETIAEQLVIDVRPDGFWLNQEKVGALTDVDAVVIHEGFSLIDAIGNIAHAGARMKPVLPRPQSRPHPLHRPPSLPRST